MEEALDYIEDPLPQHRARRVDYPPRLMVDFKSLTVAALKRYAAFFQLSLQDDYNKDEIAALVARHFDSKLDVEEDDSIVAFMQRVRNGERNPNNPIRTRDRNGNSEKRGQKKNGVNGRKRQRDTGPVGGKNGTSTRLSDKKNSGGKNNGRKAPKVSDDAYVDDNELYCICNRPSFGNMIACDGKHCPNPMQWYHLECVGFSDGRHPDTWLCPECDPQSHSINTKKSRKAKPRSKSPGNK